MHSILDNLTVQELSWESVNVSVSKRRSKESKTIVQNVNGFVQAGEMLAIMGPSGSGKTTLLNALAQRPALSNTRIFSTILVNGQQVSRSYLRKVSRFVESEDDLIGALTVQETLYFATQFGLGAEVSNAKRNELIDEMLSCFGLVEHAHTIVGTMIRRGISTGQKRRLSVAAQLISAPRILFLDEPTSGLDSAASFKVMSYLRSLTKKHNLLVVCSIHQPSSTTFALFDRTLLMSKGKPCFFGTVDSMQGFLDATGHPMPMYSNPAEFVLDLINIDFETDIESAHLVVDKILKSWEAIERERMAQSAGWMESKTRMQSCTSVAHRDQSNGSTRLGSGRSIITIMHRSWIKSQRDVLVYGARLVMYLGLAILMGTVWLRLPADQASIQPLAHCILFGSAFTSFMAVVYVPAFIEDYRVYIKDRSNGLYGSSAFVVSNLVIGLPYLFILALIPSIFVYWMVNFRADGSAFMLWVLWSYLNLLAAESLVVLISALLPDFIGSLAAFAMLNAIFMACNGFMVPRTQLNAFYRYVFYYIDYQGYVYRGLARNEYAYREYSCGSECQCMITTPLAANCLIAGEAVLHQLGFGDDRQAVLVGIMIGIIVVLRLLGWAALSWR